MGVLCRLPGDVESSQSGSPGEAAREQEGGRTEKSEGQNLGVRVLRPEGSAD